MSARDSIVMTQWAPSRRRCLRKDCSPTFHSDPTTEALPQAAAVKVAMFVNREVKHIDSEPGSLRLVASVGTDRSPTPYKMSTPGSVETPVVTENHSCVVPPAAPRPHRDVGVQLKGFRDNMDPVSSDTGFRGWLIDHPCFSFRIEMQVTRVVC